MKTLLQRFQRRMNNAEMIIRNIKYRNKKINWNKNFKWNERERKRWVKKTNKRDSVCYKQCLQGRKLNFGIEEICKTTVSINFPEIKDNLTLHIEKTCSIPGKIDRK